jgi:hypothetical protein
MNTMHGAMAVVASVLAMLLAPSDTANARAGGMHARHFSGHHHSAHHRARHRLPLYGGYLFLPPYEPYVAPQPIVLVSEPHRCRYDRQVVTVASEQGGTRQITVTRC